MISQIEHDWPFCEMIPNDMMSHKQGSSVCAWSLVACANAFLAMAGNYLERVAVEHVTSFSLTTLLQHAELQEPQFQAGVL